MQKKIIAIVPAAGIGKRAESGAVAPKQYRLIKGRPMLYLAVSALLADSRITQVRVALAPNDTQGQLALRDLPRTVCRPCGGPSRAATVTAALDDAQLDPDDWVLVHDAARPGLAPHALAQLIDTCLARNQGGLLAQPVADTVKLASTEANCAADPATVVRTLSRDRLWLAQTPQMFPAGLLLQALQKAQAAQKAQITDEASAMEYMGYEALLVPGSARNFKVTWPEDFDLMEKWL